MPFRPSECSIPRYKSGRVRWGQTIPRVSGQVVTTVTRRKTVLTL